MTAKLPKTLDLGMGAMGGHTHFYARNVQRNGDWATVGYFVGKVEDNAEILICAHREFNSPEYIKQMQDHLLEVNPSLKFANDQKDSSFISMDAVLEVAVKRFNLANFEVSAVRANPDKLHEVYLAAQPAKLDTLPSQYNYEFENGNYPIYQVFHAVTEVIHGI